MFWILDFWSGRHLFESLIGLILFAIALESSPPFGASAEFVPQDRIPESASVNAQQDKDSFTGEIFLRNLQRIDAAKITGYDELKVLLSDGTTVGWEEILRADLKDEHQSKFEENIASFGIPFYRLQHRLEIEDWIGAGKLAERLPVRFQTHPSKCGALVNIALFKSYMATGQRELAVAPWLRILKCSTHQKVLQELDKQFENDPSQFESGIANGLLPVFFDQELATKVLATIQEEFEIPAKGWAYREALEIRTGIRTVYSNRPPGSEQKAGETDEWQIVLLTAREALGRTGHEYRDLLKERISELSPPAYWAGRYWLAKANLDSTENKANADLALEFLDVAANCESRFPELSAAVLWEANEILKSAGRLDDSKKIELELLRSFPRSYHGRSIQPMSKDK